MTSYLTALYDLPPDRRNFGYELHPQGLAAERKIAAQDSVPEILAADQAKDAVLWSALYWAWPDWTWGWQGTGDCVSWGTGHLMDCLMAVQAFNGQIRKPDGLVCRESIYGFGKCELFNSYGRHGAGMMGVDAANAIQKYGTLYYGKYTAGGQEYDLSAYSGSRAISWGEAGRGVPDPLEPLAAQHKAKDKVAVIDVKTAGAMVQAGYAIQFCGMGAPWGVERQSDGYASRLTSGAHCMTITGVRYDGQQEPQGFWIANTGHGPHCSGPVGPIAVPEAYAACGSWLRASQVAPILAARDCFATTFVNGWPVLKLPDWGTSEYL